MYITDHPVDTGRKLNVWCTFNLRPVSTGQISFFEKLSFLILSKDGNSMKKSRKINTVIPLIRDFIFIRNSIMNQEIQMLFKKWQRLHKEMTSFLSDL